VREAIERKAFFFEKKNQKTFIYGASRLWQHLRQIDKSFLLLF